jgi:hypothetical protein
MITRELYETLEPEERKLWHSHVFEVKSGQLVMPKPAGSLMPTKLWEIAETKEMEEVVNLYGKTWHMWQVWWFFLRGFGGLEILIVRDRWIEATNCRWVGPC